MNSQDIHAAPDAFYLIHWHDRLTPERSGYLGRAVESNGHLVPFTDRTEAEIRANELQVRQITTIVKYRRVP